MKIFVKSMSLAILTLFSLFIGCSSDWQCEVKYPYNWTAAYNGKIKQGFASQKFAIDDGSCIAVQKGRNDNSELSVKIYDDSWLSSANTSAKTSAPFGIVTLCAK